MTRTKVPRKAQQKRNRRSSVEEREMKLRELDTMAENYLSCAEDDRNNYIRQCTDDMTQLKQKISNRVMKLTMEGIREMTDIRSIYDLTMVSGKEHNATMASDISTIASLTMVGESLRLKEQMGMKKRSQQDEGYLTEEGSQSNRSSGVGSYKSSQSSLSSRIIGPLASAKAKERRSRSAGPTATPLKTSVMGPSKTFKGLSVHSSRSKFKTPIHNRPKAISADRLCITPKVPIDHPMAILRRAHAGETVFSVAGSPVISSSAAEDVANVNIPVLNGVLSIRPTQMGAMDAQVVKNLDATTIEQLRTLQQNLNKLMHAAEKRNFSVK